MNIKVLAVILRCDTQGKTTKLLAGFTCELRRFFMPTHSPSRRSTVTTLLAFLICCSLLFSTLALARSDHSSISGQGQSRRGHPEAGPPAANLPNLDAVRRRRPVVPQVEIPISSPTRFGERRTRMSKPTGTTSCAPLIHTVRLRW